MPRAPPVIRAVFPSSSFLVLFSFALAVLEAANAVVPNATAPIPLIAVSYTHLTLPTNREV